MERAIHTGEGIFAYLHPSLMDMALCNPPANLLAGILIYISVQLLHPSFEDIGVNRPCMFA
jgi:hypothetical protein